MVRKSNGFTPAVKRGRACDGCIVLAKGAAKGAEAYSLEVGAKRVTIEAGTVAGLFRGATTLWQMIPAGDSPAVPAVKIDDAPRFAWRGVMLDSARQYQSPEFILRFIDAMALEKLNVLHWHLTDDQAWRIEIRKYPRLTEVGAWRVPAGHAAHQDIDPSTGKPRLYGGFYSQATVKRIVAYAAEREITVVPEIEMPGHAAAALVAYPALAASKTSVPKAVSADWGIFPQAYSLDDSTFAFLEDVLTEVMALFPSRYIHVGGDEVQKGEWLASERGRALMAQMSTTDPERLQAYFTQRIARFLESHGRRLVGWDEILAPGLPKGAVVMSWRGIDGAVHAAREGYDAVVAAHPTFYFDNRQSASPAEPPGRGRVVSLEDVYRFDPVPAGLSAEEARHVIGVEGNVWTEHIRTEERVGWMTFPRAAAIAELGWSAPSQRATCELPRARRGATRSLRRPRHDLRDECLRPGAAAARGRPHLQPGPRALQRRHRDLARGRCAGRGAARGLPRGHREPVLDRQGRGPRSREIAHRRRWAGAVQLPDRRGREEDQVRRAHDRAPGELEVHLDRCDGKVVATLPLAPAAGNDAVTVLPGVALEGEGVHDLCLRFAQPRLEPLWVIDWIRFGGGRAMSVLRIASPLSGWCMPLAEVPDPVFSGAMAGDGIAVDPLEGALYAPCDGVIVPLRGARHALTVKSDEGIEILVHVGIDTVKLEGRGFDMRVAPGERVKRGELLLRFDLDALARGAPSLVTPVVVAAGGTVVVRNDDRRVAVGDIVMEVEAEAATASLAAPAPETVRRFRVPFDHGLHARPAAQVAAALRPFAAQVVIVARGRSASARSTVSMMSLGVHCNETIEVRVTGADAAQALAALEPLFAPEMPEVVRQDAPAPRARLADSRRIEGVAAGRGVSVGVAVRWAQDEIAIEARGTDAAKDTRQLREAIASVKDHLDAAAKAAAGQSLELLRAHAELVEDPELFRLALESIARGRSAAAAWRESTRGLAASLAALDDPRMRERASDLRDLEDQVIRVLRGEKPAVARELPQNAIVLADDLLPSQFLALDLAKLGGIALARGGATSHVAILSAAAAVPMLVAAGPAVLEVADGTPVVLDTEHGWLDVDPPAPELAAARQAAAQRAAERAADLESAQQPCSTLDGVRIVVNANVGSVDEARAAVRNGAEGCGLLRTEFLFLERREAARRGRAGARVLAHRRRARQAAGERSAPWTWAATSRSPTCRCRARRIPRSACAACVRASGARSCCARSSPRFFAWVARAASCCRW